MDAKTYTIADLAMEFAVSFRTIRFYEERQMLEPIKLGSQRHYSAQDRTRLALILEGKRLGFTLTQIKNFLVTASSCRQDGSDVPGIASYLTGGQIKARIAELAEQMASTQAALLSLQTMLADRPAEQKAEDTAYPKLRRYHRAGC